MGTQQGMPRKLVFGDHHTKEIPDGLDNVGEWDDELDDDMYTGTSSDDEDLDYDDELLNGNDNTDYNESSNDCSVLEEPPLDSLSSSSRSDSDTEIHHPSDENETSEEDTSDSENTIQLNSDKISQEESPDDESGMMEPERTTGVDGGENVELGEPSGVVESSKTSFDSESEHKSNDNLEDSLVEDECLTLSHTIEEAMQAGASAVNDRKTLPKHQRK